MELIIVIVCILGVVLGIAGCFIDFYVGLKKYMLVIDNEVKYFKSYQQAIDCIKIRFSVELVTYKLFVKDNENYVFIPIDVEAL